jgi:hypothetical protein
LSQRHHEGHHEREHARASGFHKDWRTWVAVIVMLGAMGMYLSTLDDSVAAVGEVPAYSPATPGALAP